MTAPILSGNWTVHADGTLTATGKSAQIVPPEGCTWSPSETFGFGAKGGIPTLEWGGPIDVPAEFWIRGLPTSTLPTVTPRSSSDPPASPRQSKARVRTSSAVRPRRG